MKYKLLFFSSVIMVIVLLLASCKNSDNPSGISGNPVDTTASNARALQAYQSMENEFDFWFNNSFHNASDYDRLNFETANALYREALTLNPNNSTAHFGAAISELLTMYADTAVNSAVKRWESYTNGHPFSESVLKGGIPVETQPMTLPLGPAAFNVIQMFNAALADPPLISEMQAIVRDRILPRVDYAISNLAAIEQDSTFRFRVSGKMQGDPNLEPVYLYITEVYFTESGLQGAKLVLEEFLMYRFDLPDYSQASLVNALQQNNTTFFVLASDGMAHAQNAKTAFQTMIDKAASGIHFLESYSGIRSDAAIKIGSNGVRQRDLDSIKVYLQKIKSSLSAPLTVELKNADSDGNTYTIQIFLGSLFDNPAQNPKAQFFPAYTVTPAGTNGLSIQFTGQTYADFNFPDATFNNMLPGMTNDRLKRILRLDTFFAYDWHGYAYFESSYQGIPYATVRIQTSSKIYTKQTDQWGSFRFLILDSDNMPYRLFINYGTGDIELTSSYPMIITPKTREYRSIVISMAPYGLTLTKVTGPPLGVRLDWQPYSYSGGYVIQRSEGAGSIPADYTSADYQTSYYDYNVVSGHTYRYRIKLAPGGYYYWSFYIKDPLLSDIAEITP